MKNKVNIQINLTALLDVFLIVLLFFFYVLCESTQDKSSVKNLNLPVFKKSKAESSNTKFEILKIILDKKGEIFVSHKGGENKKIQLIENILSDIKSINRTQVKIYSDKMAPVGKLLEVFLFLQDKQIKDVEIVGVPKLNDK